MLQSRKKLPAEPEERDHADGQDNFLQKNLVAEVSAVQGRGSEIYIEPNDDPLPSLHELKQPIIKALREERHSLAAAMEKSEIWNLNGNVLSLTFNTPFESTFIEKECREIEGIIGNSLGWDIKIKTVIKEKNEVSLDNEIEEQVELVRDVFRGTIIKRS